MGPGLMINRGQVEEGGWTEVKIQSKFTPQIMLHENCRPRQVWDAPDSGRHSSGGRRRMACTALHWDSDLPACLVPAPTSASVGFCGHQ